MIVVENDCQGLAQGFEIIEQMAGQHRRRWEFGGLQQLRGGAAGIVSDGVDSGHQVLKKQPEIALILVEGQPRDRMFAVLGPLGDEHALAVAGGRRNQGQGHLEGPVHQPQEPIPAHHIERHRRSVQLGADQGRGTLSRIQSCLQPVRKIVFVFNLSKP